MVDSVQTLDSTKRENLIQVNAGALVLQGLLNMPADARGVVILTHDIESVQEPPHAYALALAQAFSPLRMATLQVDLFTGEEQQLDAETSFFRTNTSIMEQRIRGIAAWLTQNPAMRNLSIGYFGTGVSGAAAVLAAVMRPDVVQAIVLAGARIDLAQEYLRRLLAPTMLIAAQNESVSVRMNQDALDHIRGAKRLELVPADALFANQHTLDEVARLAGEWFAHWLVPIV
ncbi:MAG TPA: hypothetical protein VFA10_27920 [Ktedonobacteraceae bacterium]|nr:hypothetical protein [Ktedonobacteraceae bacterium]